MPHDHGGLPHDFVDRVIRTALHQGITFAPSSVPWPQRWPITSTTASWRPSQPSTCWTTGAARK